MKKIIILILILSIFCIRIFATDECTYLAKIAATYTDGEPFVVKVVFCEMILNRTKHNEFPNTMPAIAYSLGMRGALKKPSNDDKKAAELAMSGTDFGGGALYFEKWSKIKRTPPEKRGGVRLYEWYFYG